MRKLWSTSNKARDTITQYTVEYGDSWLKVWNCSRICKITHGRLVEHLESELQNQLALLLLPLGRAEAGHSQNHSFISQEDPVLFHFGWAHFCLGQCIHRPFSSKDNGPVRLSYNSYFSTCFFSQNSLFLSQQISRNDISTCFFGEENKANGVVRIVSQNWYYHLNDDPSHPWPFLSSIRDSSPWTKHWGGRA